MFHNFYKYKCNYSIEMFYQGFKSELSFLKKKCQPNFHRAWTTGHCAWCVCALLCVCVWGRECLKKKNSLYFMICTRKMSKLMIWMNDLNAWHHICFLMHVLSVATGKGQQRRRTEEGKRKIIGVCFFCCLISRQSLISLIIKLLSKQRQAGRNWPSPAAYTSGGRV